MIDNYIKIYGPTMSLPQVARVLHLNEQTLRNYLSMGREPVLIYKIGRKLVADTTDVVNYLEDQKAQKLSH